MRLDCGPVWLVTVSLSTEGLLPGDDVLSSEGFVSGQLVMGD